MQQLIYFYVIVFTGLLRDITGSYVASFHLLGGLAYVGGVLALLIPFVNKWTNGKEDEQIVQEENINKA